MLMSGASPFLSKAESSVVMVEMEARVVKQWGDASGLWLTEVLEASEQEPL